MIRNIEALSEKLSFPVSALHEKDFNQAFDEQLSLRVSHGFHKELGLTVGEYVESFQHLLNPVLNKPFSVGYPVFVEPRIPIRDQLDLLGVYVDPTAYSLPEDSTVLHPYLSRVRQVYTSDLPPENVEFALRHKSLSSGTSIRLAGLLEALARFDFSLPEYIAGPFDARVLCVDTFSGRPRLSKPEHGVIDGEIRHALVSISERRYHG